MHLGWLVKFKNTQHVLGGSYFQLDAGPKLARVLKSIACSKATWDYEDWTAMQFRERPCQTSNELIDGIIEKTVSSESYIYLNSGGGKEV